MAFSPLPRNYDEAIKEINVWRAKYTREARDEIEAQRRQVAELKQPCCQEWHTCNRPCVPLAENWRMDAKRSEQRIAELEAQNAALRELINNIAEKIHSMGTSVTVASFGNPLLNRVEARRLRWNVPWPCAAGGV